MKILLIDFESTGVDTSTARITEIGAMLVDEKFEPLDVGISELVWETGYPALTEEVTKVTGITQDMLNKDAITPEEAFADLDLVADGCDFAIAYNRAYDENLLRAELARGAYTMLPGLNQLMQVPWLCAMQDIESNYAFKSWKQMHVALDYGITVNPKLLHRAIGDVELMRQILVASNTSVEEMLAFQKDPWVYLAISCKAPWLDEGKSTQEAKGLGYSWEAARGDFSGVKFSKAWVKRVKSKHVQQEQHKTNLIVREIQP